MRSAPELQQFDIHLIQPFQIKALVFLLNINPFVLTMFLRKSSTFWESLQR